MLLSLSKNILRWLAQSRLLVFPRRLFKKIVCYSLRYANGVLLFYNEEERAPIMDRIRRIKDENEMLLSDSEAYQIYMTVHRTSKIEGDISEVGVFKGASAKLICEAKGNKTLHLFDTFEGLPELNEFDNPKEFYKGQFAAGYDEVKKYLNGYTNIQLYKGLFPITADPIKSKKFSFVHLDLDIHQSTLDAIRFFYPRMSKGGIIISHDYISASGVKKAFDQFFADKSEPVIELSGSQCLVMKL